MATHAQQPGQGLHADLPVFRFTFAWMPTGGPTSLPVSKGCAARVSLTARLCQPSLEVVAPAVSQRGNLDGAPRKGKVLLVRDVKAQDIGHRHVGRFPIDQLQSVPRSNFAFLNHGEIKAGAAAL